MSNWKSDTLGNIVNQGDGLIQTGPFGSQLHASDYVEVGVPCIMPINLKNNRIDISKVSYISKEDARRLSKHILKEGDIVYSRRGDITQKALIGKREEGYFCGTGCLLLRPGKVIDSGFLLYLLSTDSSIEWLKNNAVGITMPNLNTKILADIPIKFPEKQDQTKIAKILSNLDSKISHNNHINFKLEAMANTIYDYWFLQFDFPISNEQAKAMGKPKLEGKPYKASGGKMVWSEDLKREIPAIWKAGSLTNIIEFNPTISLSKGAEASYIDMDALPQSGFMTKAPMKKAFNGGMKFQNGDIAVARITPCLENGKTGLITLLKDGEIGFGSTEFIILRGRKFDLRSYASCLARSAKFRAYAISKMSGTSGRKRVSASDLEMYELAIPDDDTLKRFEQLVTPFFEKMTLNALENQKLAELRDWLLPMLMNGQVRIKETSQSKGVNSAFLVSKPANSYFYQTQLVAAIVNASKKNKITHGEMTLAKYTYLVDKLYGVPTYFNYERLHLGPYPKEMKKVVNNKKFFKIHNNEVSVVPQNKEYNYEFKPQVENAIADLASIFNQFRGKERSHQTELLATVCKVVEDIQSTNLKKVRESMKKWPIELKGEKFKNKAEKFGEEETKECLRIIQERWIGHLITR